MPGLKRSIFTVNLAALFCGRLVSQGFRAGRGALGFGGKELSMRHVFAGLFFLLCGLFFLPSLAAQGMPIPNVDPNDTAVLPGRRSASAAGWMPRHEGLVANVKYNQKIVFIGDSITHFYERAAGIWNWTLLLKQYNKKLSNIAIGGDQTQHVIWRMQNGAFPAGINPQYVVLMIGTNNRQAPESIAAGIGKIIQMVNAASPSTKIVLMSILPRGTGNDDANTIRNNAVNSIIKNYHGYLNVMWLDISQYYVNPDGSLKNDLFTDKIHLSQAGFDIWREKLMEVIK